MDDDAYPPGNFQPDDAYEEEAYPAAGSSAAAAAGPPASSSSSSSRKRKRELPDVNAALTSEQIQAKLHHLNRSLLAQAKKAQTFELQRLNKHKKDAKRDVSKDGEIDASIAALKTLTLPSLVASALYTKLHKTHLLTHYPILVPLVPVPPPSTPAPAADEAKAANRILSNKTFAKEMGEGLKRVKTWVDSEFKVAEKAKAREEQREAAPAPASEEDAAPKKAKAVSGRSAHRAAAAEAAEGQSSDDEGRVLPDMVSDDEEDGAAAVDPANPLGLNNDYFSGGSDSEEEDDDGASQASWSSGSVSSQPPVPAKKSKTAASSSAKPAARASSSTPPPERKAPKPKEKAKPVPKKVTSSLFLPSLAAGYTLGGSDSEPEQLSDDGKNERKNRRGQRARKAIWEKKYGANANHLKAQRAEGKSAESGPTPSYVSSRGTRGGRGGFVQSSRGRGGKFVAPAGTDAGWGASGAAAAAGAAAAPARGGFAGRGGFSAGAPSTRGGFAAGGAAHPARPPPKEKKPEKEMHPSWVAKQKLKEKMSAGVPAAGKKITFD